MDVSKVPIPFKDLEERYRSCAVVAPAAASVLAGQGTGPSIDAHEAVVRFDGKVLDLKAIDIPCHQFQASDSGGSVGGNTPDVITQWFAASSRHRYVHAPLHSLWIPTNMEAVQGNSRHSINLCGRHKGPLEKVHPCFDLHLLMMHRLSRVSSILHV